MAFDVEQLFQSVDIILTQRLQDVHFDKTIICTIVDDSDKKNGCYVVSDGTIKFKAYVSDATYNKDDQVRVSVLNGDFSEKKFITGRYTGDENSSPITYKSPLESIIPITDNLVTETRYNKNGVNGLKANSDTIQLELWRADLTSNTEFRDLQSNGIYNTLTLKADFKTLLSKYDLISGNYGLRLDLFIQPSFDNPTQRIRRYVTLDSSEMMGNPYSFSVYSTQAKKVDIVSTGVIAEMVLWLYQSINGDGEGRRFIDKSGNLIPVNPLIDDILVKNIEIGFGSDIEKISDNTLEIFTSSPPYYVYQNPTDLTNQKQIELLWYNKTDDNKYIGFSDGLYDPNYDEIEYLKLSNRDARLCAQIGRDDIPNDEPGLKLAADLKDAKPLMLKARNALTNEVVNVLYSLQRQVKSANSISTEIDKLLSIIDDGNSLVSDWNDANEAIENWSTTYRGVLQYAYNKQNKIESSWDVNWNTDYYKVFVEAIESGIKKVRDFFIWFDGVTQPLTTEGNISYQSAHRGNYDLYNYRMENELTLIEDWLNQIDDLLDGNFNKLIKYSNNNYVFYEYKVTDFSNYTNKYCIYWYRYERGYKLEYQKDADNDEYNFGNFVENGWRRLTKYNNFGLPTEKNSKDPNYYAAKALNQVFTRTMDRNFTEEKYMVVLFHNHEMYKSNVITFTNSEPELIPNDYLLDKRDALRIEHDADSREHYQAYNEFNLLKSLEDGGKVRQLKCFYDGLFKKDEALINAGLYWYVPNHSTMLTFDTEALMEEGFSTDAKVQTEYSIPGYTYFYKKIRICKEEDKIEEDGVKYDTCRNEDRCFFYKIKPYLEKDAQNNTILVRAYLQGLEDPVEGEITMTFSSFGTNGTKYTLSIVPSGSQVAVNESNPLKLAVNLHDSKNKRVSIFDADNGENDNAYNFTVESLQDLPNAFAYEILKDTENKNKVIGLSVSIPSETITNWPEGIPYFGIINAKVNFRIDKNEDLEESEKVNEYQKYRVLDLNTLYAITYSSSNKYYMSGATHIVYNNQGVISYVSEDKYELYTINEKGNAPVENQKWSIKYYKSAKTNSIVIPVEVTDLEELAIIRNYMPVLNSENRLTPAPLYINDLEYIPVVICEVGEDIAWVQPIIITQNRYASSTLNDWNGSFTINEKNGTILATAFGAGKKEDDNSFSGVLMGNIGKGTNFDTDNMDGLGIYGFHQGDQSFCLSSDGRAFFGKAGRGRIYFDGDSGTIASASYEMVRRNNTDQDSAGMLIDMDDGYIHMLGAKKEDIDGNSEYKSDYGDEFSQAEILISTGLVNNISDAYFKIRSKNQTNLDHYLIYIDQNDYFLQTDDYKEYIFNSSDDRENNNYDGAGLRLDLKDGSLNSYNFKLVSKNVMINSQKEYEPYFVVKNNDGRNLIYVGGTNSYEEFYIQSANFNTSNRSGIRIDFTDNPRLEAYGFQLQAGSTTQSTAIVTISDGGKNNNTIPYFEVNSSNGKTLACISSSEQYFQSSDYVAGSSGIKLDLARHEFSAYSGFYLNATDSTDTNKYITISANTNHSYPLQIGLNCQVDWAGNLTCIGMNAENANLSGTLNVGDSLTVNGTLTGGTISGATIEGGILSVGNGQLYADSSGVVIQNAKIKNCEIENSSIANGDGSANTSFGVNAAGYMTGLGCSLTNGIFTTCTVSELLTCNGSILLTGSNTLNFGNSESLYFGNSGITCSGSMYAVNGFSAPTVSCSTLTTSYYDGSQSSLLLNVACSMKVSGSIECSTIKTSSSLWIGTEDIASFVNRLIDAKIAKATISLKGSYVTDNGNNTASVSIPYSGTTPDSWLGWDTSSTGRIYSTEYGTDSGSASGRTYYTKANGQSYSGTSKTTVTATLNIK